MVTVTYKIRQDSGAIIGKTSWTELPPNVTGLILQSTDEEITQEYYWDGSQFVLREHLETVSFTVLSDVETTVAVHDGAHTMLFGECVSGDRTFTPRRGHTIIQYCGRYSGEIVINALDIDEARSKQTDLINQARDKALLIADTSYGLFDADATSLANINGQVLAINVMAGTETPITTVDWRMANNVTQTFSAGDFVKAALAVAATRSATYSRSWNLKALIAAAETLAEIEAVVWTD